MPKFNKNKKELFSTQEKWCYFFKHAHQTTEADLKKIIGSDNIIHKAYTALNQYYWTEDELRAYEAMKRERMDQKAILEYKIDEGKAIGKVEGEAIGIEKGKMEVAKNLLQNEFTMDAIIQFTNLSKEQLDDLKKYTFDETSAVNF